MRSEKSGTINDKSMSFAVRIVNLYKYLIKNQAEYVISKQLLRSGTSIGANVSESVLCAVAGRFQLENVYCLERSKRNGVLA